MKKIIISILTILLLVLAYFVIFNDIHILNWDNISIKDIKDKDKELNDKINTAKETNQQKYPQSISSLETSMEQLKKTKDKYLNKVKYLSEDLELGVVQIKEYKIDKLWVALGNYAKDENVNLKLDVMETGTKDVYDLNVTIIGEYIGITAFIYDIEKDDTLGFRIVNFKIAPNTTTTETTSSGNNTSSSEKQYTTYVSVSGLKATFKIESVGIDFN